MKKAVLQEKRFIGMGDTDEAAVGQVTNMY